ncbi:MFS transporter [Rhodococcus sp. BP-252]|uniref:MFS transporter n=1 Tax=unclassified Rhodococcus (in: high G+C Gram-positive bacteria) TaxID=192944 RepID=UPI001C9ACA7F|nr:MULTISPECIES: MFS transporter [unclassified Rhodococcus (in: high G+C Gram-positive bacteria)]MBY6414662.1 MFS transporter [Rhodococcus sp. BP-320]MBY6419487.1 MFS transporter [Rhodococcus sp. BP-321]MBY6424501.1 MFS transporter [Rhodococcus sp. BP-324]MBY6429498.1 MFS transporter [Rhodococcus sp. BP-323]MBY6434511.1 MFS transporter [Rhodococcus sp. BP-322]
MTIEQPPEHDTDNDRHLDISDTLFRKMAWRILPIIGVAYTIAIIDRVNVGFAKLQMSADIGLSAASYGLGAGIFFLAYCLFEMPSNVILERVGARLWISRILITWGLVTIGTAFVQNTGQFYAARVLLGVAEAGFYPGMIFYLSRWFPRKRLGRAISLMVVAAPVGSMLVGPLSGWMINSFDGNVGLRGWQWMFMLQGLPAVVMGIVFLAAMVDSPDKARWLSPGEKQNLLQALPTHTPHPRMIPQLRSALGNLRIWLFGVVLATNYLGTYAVIFWLPTIIAGLGVDDVAIVGWLSAVPWTCAVLATVMVGVYCDRKQTHSKVIFVGMAAAALGLVISVAFGQYFSISIAGISCAAAFFTATGPIIWAMTNIQLASFPAAAAGVALVNAIGSLGSFLGPYAVGLGRDLTGSIVVPLVVIAVITVGGGVLGLGLLRQRSALSL